MPDTPISDDDLPDDEPQLFRVADNQALERLDKVLAQLVPRHSRSRLQTWIERGHVLVNGTVVLEQGTYTGAKPGTVLRGPGWDGNK